MWEYVGFVASALIILSFAMKQMKPLRWINLVGCVLFVAYGIQINSAPVILTNVAIVGINIYYLFLYKSDKAD